MDKQATKETIEPKEATGSEEWLKTSEIRFTGEPRQPSKDTGGEHYDKANEARNDVLDTFKSQAVSERGEKMREMVCFAGVSIPKKYLGEDLIIQKEVEPPVSDGLLGKLKRLLLQQPNNEEIISQLLDEEEDLSDDNIKELLTPQVAYGLVNKYKEGDLINERAAKLIESLPISSQEEIFNSRQRDYNYFRSGIWIGSNKSPSFLMKTFACGANMLASKDQSKDVDMGYFSSLVLNYKLSLGTVVESEKRAILEGAYEDMACIIDGIIKASPENNNNSLKKLRLTLAKELLPKEYFYDHFDEIIDADFASSNAFSFCDLRDVYEIFGAENEDEQKKMEIIPEKMRVFYEQNRKIMRDKKVWYGDLTCDDIDWVNKQLEKYISIIPNRELLTSVLISKNEDYLHVLELLDKSEKSQVLISNAEKYIKMTMGSAGYSNLFLGTSIESIDDLKNWGAFLESQTRTQFKDCNDREDYVSAKEILSVYLYGVEMIDIASDLVALGIVDMPIDREVDKIDGVYAAQEKFKVTSINTKLLDKMVQSGELSNHGKNLILDAINLINCRPKSLIKNFEDIMSKKESEGVELGEILQELREQRIRRASANFDKYMTETMEKGTEFVGNVSYDGKEIPVLRMVGDDCMVLVHHLGAYSYIENSTPEQWNEAQREIIEDSSGEKRIGYISTCPIARGCVLLAAKEEEIKDPNEIYYGFVKTGENGLLYMSEYDLYTIDWRDRRDMEDKTLTMGFSIIEEDPRELIKRTKEAVRNVQKLPHGEVVLDRYAGDINRYGGRLQPNYLMVFTDDINAISENVKKHAAYFGVPIVMVDYDEYSK